MTVIWRESQDGDFKNYKLLHSFSLDGNKDTLTTITDKKTTSYVLTDFDVTIENYYWILVSDTLGQSTISHEYKVIDSPPEAPFINPIIYKNNSFYISWGQNNEDDFSSYKLYESLSETMSSKTLIYETNKNTDTTYVVTGINEDEVRYYQIIVEDYWGLESESEIEVGNSYGWVMTFGEREYEKGYCVQQTNDEGYIITGYTNSLGNGQKDVWLIKTNPRGNKEWSKTFGGVFTERGYSVQQTKDGGYIITGFTYSSTGNSNADVWLIKTDSQGNEEWNQTFGGIGGEVGFSVQQTTDGGYAIIGSTSSFGNGSSDVWLIKTDSQGNEEWNKTFGGSSEDVGRSVQQVVDGGYIITGFTLSYGNGNYDVLLIKTDSQGKTEP
jgi:hypothetical protein